VSAHSQISFTGRKGCSPENRRRRRLPCRRPAMRDG
jgi:hypothetical protein